jgi:hypothetical protein
LLFNQNIEELNFIIDDTDIDYSDLIIQNVSNNFSLKNLEIIFSSQLFKHSLQKEKIVFFF